MNKLIKIAAIITGGFILSCNSKDWTEEEKKEFEIKCQERVCLENVSFHFTGFEMEEIDTVLINEYKDQNLVNSFFIYHNNNTMYSKPITQYIISPKDSFATENKYELKVNDSLTYVIDNIKLEMQPENTMLTKSYGCHMVYYTVNKKPFENHGFFSINK